jgi:predicted alpha-1,2-mannosidase
MRKQTRIWRVLAVACLLSGMPVLAASTDPVLQVNTFIGTQEEGNTFPGASAPFGMIQVSPITEHYAGYRYDDTRIRGFGHSFVSGAGCWEQGGLVATLPVTGRIGPGRAFDTSDAKARPFDYKTYAAAYTHAGEVGQAGYYKVRLTDYNGIEVETTALTRAAAERYTFAAGEKTGHVLVNVGQANEKHEVVGSVIEVAGDRAVEGKLVTRSFCGGKQYTTWFRIEFDRPFQAFGTWDREGGVPGGRHSVGTQWDVANGAWLSFDLAGSRSVTATSAISHVDADGARRNLDAEGKHAGKLLAFDAMRAQAQAAWRKELGVVRIDGAPDDDRVVFDTALYHAFLQPMTGSDADGRYRGYDEAIHVAEGWTYHEYFSLWDTYRTQNQLLAILKPAARARHRALDAGDPRTDGLAAALGIRQLRHQYHDRRSGDAVAGRPVALRCAAGPRTRGLAGAVAERQWPPAGDVARAGPRRQRYVPCARLRALRPRLSVQGHGRGPAPRRFGHAGICAGRLRVVADGRCAG